MTMKSTLECINAFEKEKDCTIIGIEAFSSSKFSIQKMSDGAFVLSAEIPLTNTLLRLLRLSVLPPISVVFPNKHVYSVPQGMAVISEERSDMFKPTAKVKIRLSYLLLDSNSIHKSYYRVVQPISNKEDWCRNISVYGTSVDGVLGNLLDLNINDYHFRVYNYSNDRNFLVFDSVTPITLEILEEIHYSLLLALGLFTNKVILGDAYTIESTDVNFENNIAICKFHKQIDSIQSKYEIYTRYPCSYSNIVDLHRIDYCAEQIHELDKIGIPFVEPIIIENLCNKLVQYPNLQRALQIVLESSSLSLEIQASAYFIALETLCDVFEKKILPKESAQIVDEKLWKDKIAPVIEKSINSIDDSILSSTKKDLLSKSFVGKCNKMPNGEKLNKPFDYVLYTLSELDKKTIRDGRNRYLHGNVTGHTFEAQFDGIRRDCYNVHKLCCILLLRLADFNGYIINNAVANGFEKEISNKEKLFIKIPNK